MPRKNERERREVASAAPLLAL